MHDILLEQLPFLSTLKRFLAELKFFNPPLARSPLILESMDTFRDEITQQCMNEAGWVTVAKNHAEKIFTQDRGEIQKQARK